MPTERDWFDEWATTEALPESAQPREEKPTKKRPDAPEFERPIRYDPERQAARYGRPKTFRLPDDFLEMLDQVKAKYGIKPPELIQLTVSQYVAALEEGKVNPPVKGEGARSVVLELPAVPRVKRGRG